MFNKSERVPREILAAFQGTRLTAPHFALRFRQNGLPHSRFAVAASLKVDQKASQRHTLKRRAAHILKNLECRGVDVFLTLLPGASAISRDEFAEELRSLLRKAAQNICLPPS